MGNPAGKSARREEETAFLCMEQVLRVDIKLADAGGGDKRPDGFWVYPDCSARRGIVEVTSPPAEEKMKTWAADKREGKSRSESGCVPTRLGELGQVCEELLAERWAVENTEKLLAYPAHERHLFLFARTYDVENYFYRLSDTHENGLTEHVDDLALPEGISDIWFRGRAKRNGDSLRGSTEVWLARFQRASGWHRYVVSIEEQQLPSPNPSIADDKVPLNWRQPQDRTMSPQDGQD